MIDRIVQSRIEKLEALRQRGINPYPYSYPVDSNSQQAKEDVEELAGSRRQISLAGRIMLLRRMGKACFMTLKDFFGAIQLYFRVDLTEGFDLLKLIEVGDIIGVKGSLFKTRTNEITIEVDDFSLLAKSIRPLPEKYHGLSDKEIRYRQRHLDMIMNRDVFDILRQRTLVINAIREFLNKEGFYEVEVPILQTTYGGAEAMPFVTHLKSLDQRVFLSISPELFLKRFIVGGFQKVYAISKCFRNEGIDRFHNPEFTILEIYEAYVDYNEMMRLTEEMIAYICLSLKGTTNISYQGMDIDFTPPWKRIRLYDAIEEATGLDCRRMSHQDLCDKIKELGLKEVDIDQERGFLVLEIFDHCTQQDLIQPTFIYDYPKETSPLCKIHRQDPDLIERFEPIVCGVELGNAFSELNDPILQRSLLEDQAKRQRLFDLSLPVDECFLAAIESGMPPAGGLGIGVDRLVMLLSDAISIRDVIAFPFMRQEIEIDKEKGGE